MVISYVRRFLFVHVYKAAGMSVEKALWPYDVRARLTGQPIDDQRRLLSNLGVSPRILDMQRHVSATEIREALGAEFFGKLFKFAFVRNPWDLQLSLYHFNLKHPEFHGHARVVGFKNFEDFILSRADQPPAAGQQRQFIVDEDGNRLVDFVGKFETLAADFAGVCRRLGIDVALDHVNRTEHLPWQKSYTLPMFEIVRHIYQRDIEYFGYAADAAAYGIAA